MDFIVEEIKESGPNSSLLRFRVGTKVFESYVERNPELIGIVISNRFINGLLSRSAYGRDFVAWYFDYLSGSRASPPWLLGTVGEELVEEMAKLCDVD